MQPHLTKHYCNTPLHRKPFSSLNERPHTDHSLVLPTVCRNPNCSLWPSAGRPHHQSVRSQTHPSNFCTHFCFVQRQHHVGVVWWRTTPHQKQLRGLLLRGFVRQHCHSARRCRQLNHAEIFPRVCITHQHLSAPPAAAPTHFFSL